MSLLRFVLGVLGILLLIGAVSSFVALFLLGGIATGNAAFAFGLPIFLIIIGAVMVYFGFYFEETVKSGNSKIKEVFIWGIAYTVAIIISNYVVTELLINDSFLVLLSTTLLISIVAEIIRSHTYDFKLNWFLFYFLIYANLIWLVSEFVLPVIPFVQLELFTALMTGFVLSGGYCIIQMLKIRENSMKWVAIILVLAIIVSNLSFFQSLIDSLLATITPVPPPPIGSPSGNGSAILPLPPTTDWRCPETNSKDLDSTLFWGDIRPENINDVLLGSIDYSIWRVENNLRTCYNGKYKGQHPEKIYCDDMIVSRWVTDTDGTIKYRWYTVAYAILAPTNDGTERQAYAFNSLVCTDGQSIVVNKTETQIITFDTRDGTIISINIESEEPPINIEY